MYPPPSGHADTALGKRERYLRSRSFGKGRSFSPLCGEIKGRVSFSVGPTCGKAILGANLLTTMRGVVLHARLVPSLGRGADAPRGQGVNLLPPNIKSAAMGRENSRALSRLRRDHILFSRGASICAACKDIRPTTRQRCIGFPKGCVPLVGVWGQSPRVYPPNCTSAARWDSKGTRPFGGAWGRAPHPLPLTS